MPKGEFDPCIGIYTWHLSGEVAHKPREDIARVHQTLARLPGVNHCRHPRLRPKIVGRQRSPSTV